MFEIGDYNILQDMKQEGAMIPFSESAISFLQQWSEIIHKQAESRSMPDVTSFGFWCRKNASLQRKKEYDGMLDKRLGKGISLHFVSSNIPVLFAFSMAAAILAGNCVVMRISSKDNPQTKLLLRCLGEVLTYNMEWKRRIVILRYSHNTEITDELSKICDVRMIWGGDIAVREIRKSPLTARAMELTFANRSSAAVICANEILQMNDLSQLAYAFYCDTYLNDQNACSTPGMIYWVGEKEIVKQAKEKFWEAIYSYANIRYQLEPSIVIKKWEQAAYLSAIVPNIHISQKDNLIVCVEVESLKAEYWEYLTPGGFFLESSGEKLDGLLPIMTSKCQTITCFGITPGEVTDFIMQNSVKGVDRVVPCGRALDFTLVWDGYDLTTCLSRKIMAD